MLRLHDVTDMVTIIVNGFNENLYGKMVFYEIFFSLLPGKGPWSLRLNGSDYLLSIWPDHHAISRREGHWVSGL